MQITSPAFQDGEHIPEQYSRAGEDKNPPLQISGVPANARSLVLMMEDPDATRGLFTHWIVFNLDPRLTRIEEGRIPMRAEQGMNGWGRTGYGGPQPPSGDHRYFFRLQALDSRLELPAGSARDQIERATRGHVIETAVLMGRYAASREAMSGTR